MEGRGDVKGVGEGGGGEGEERNKGMGDHGGKETKGGRAGRRGKKI